jgi:hypothetical protein
VGQVIPLPPKDREWTSRERLHFDGLLIMLEQAGFRARSYEWRTQRELWFAVRETNGPVIVEIGRIGRAYLVAWPRTGSRMRTFDLRSAIASIREGWADHLPPR